jgi:hypothetical protein
VLILSDHLYRGLPPDGRNSIGTDADITIAVQPVPADQPSRLGISYRGADERITNLSKSQRSQVAQFASRPDPTALPGSMGLSVQTDAVEPSR